MANSIYSLMLLTFSLVFSVMCHSAKAQDYTLELVTENWPPNNYQLPNGEIAGFATAKVRQLFAKAQIKYTIEVLPWARAYYVAKKKSNGGIFSIMRTEKREQQFQWICPIVDPTPVYFYRLASRNDIKVNQLADLKKYLISVSRDEFDHQFLLSHGFVESKDFDISFDDKINLAKLINKRVDIIAGTEVAIKNYLTQQGLSPKHITPAWDINSGHRNDICLALNPKVPAKIVDKIKQAYKALQQEAKAKALGLNR